MPLIDENLEHLLRDALHQEAQKQGCEIIAVGGIEDHVHLLVTLPVSICVADLVKRIKGVSSRGANDFLRQHNVDVTFKWQASYAVFGVSRWDVKRIRSYILHQKEHHAQATTKSQLEDFYKPECQNEAD